MDSKSGGAPWVRTAPLFPGLIESNYVALGRADSKFIDSTHVESS